MYIFEKERKYRTKLRDREGNRDYSQEYFDNRKEYRNQRSSSWNSARNSKYVSYLDDINYKRIERNLEQTDFLKGLDKYLTGIQSNPVILKVSGFEDRSPGEFYEHVRVALEVNVKVPVKQLDSERPDCAVDNVLEDYKQLLGWNEGDAPNKMFIWPMESCYKAPKVNKPDMYLTHFDVDKYEGTASLKYFVDLKVDSEDLETGEIAAEKSLTSKFQVILKEFMKRMLVVHRNFFSRYIPDTNPWTIR